MLGQGSAYFCSRFTKKRISLDVINFVSIAARVRALCVGFAEICDREGFNNLVEIRASQYSIHAGR